MKLIPIFVSGNSEDGLWSIQMDDDSHSEFDKFFDMINDIEWLHHFFDENRADLLGGYFGHITVGLRWLELRGHEVLLG
jgi:hypothetical protein